MDIIRNKPFKFLLFFLFLYFVFFTFYNISWGSPFYFHPDERNIASSISQLTFPDNLNPHFFAYGSLPIYLVYFAGIVLNFFTNQILGSSVRFENAIVIGRLISAVLTISLVFLIFKTSKIIAGKNAAYLSLVLALAEQTAL